jgi:hypothetical protein
MLEELKRLAAEYPAIAGVIAIAIAVAVVWALFDLMNGSS